MRAGWPRRFVLASVWPGRITVFARTPGGLVSPVEVIELTDGERREGLGGRIGVALDPLEVLLEEALDVDEVGPLLDVADAPAHEELLAALGGEGGRAAGAGSFKYSNP